MKEKERKNENSKNWCSTLKYCKKGKRKKKKKTFLVFATRASWLNFTLHSYLHKQIVWEGGVLTKHMEQQ